MQEYYMKPTSWKQVLLYLAITAAMYLFYNLVESSGTPFSCPSASDNQAGATQSDIPASVTGAEPGTGLNTGTASVDGIAIINVADLPPEARTTLSLIKSGGPFPYTKDGTVFNNYEGLLPKQQTGYYREYTVITPGSKDRGVRRIVAGANGDYYYTSDHYQSFRLVKE